MNSFELTEKITTHFINQWERQLVLINGARLRLERKEQLIKINMLAPERAIKRILKNRKKKNYKLLPEEIANEIISSEESHEGKKHWIDKIL